MTTWSENLSSLISIYFCFLGQKSEDLEKLANVLCTYLVKFGPILGPISSDLNTWSGYQSSNSRFGKILGLSSHARNLRMNSHSFLL